MNLRDEIEKVAYELYEKSGRAEGRDPENWFEAERIVRARYAQKEKAVGAKEAKTVRPETKALPKAPAKKAKAKAQP